MAFRRMKIDVPRLPFVLRSKWGGKVLDEGFVPLPKRLLRSSGRLFKGERRLSNLRAILAIVDYERPNAIRAASVKYLAFLAGMPTVKFRRCLDDMTELGWLSISGPDDGVKIDYRGFIKAIEKETAEQEDDE